MPSLRQLLALYLTTPTALLASILGINSDDHATGSFGLVGKHRVEQSQAHVIGRARQVTIGEHKAKGQLFDGDQGVVLGQPVGGFMPEVFALVGDPLMPPRQLLALLVPPARKSLLAREGSVGASQLGQRHLELARGVYQRPIRQGQGPVQADINADRLAVLPWRRLHAIVALEADIPTSSGLAREDYMLKASCGARTMPLDANVADMLEIEAILSEPTPIAIAIVETTEPPDTFEAREAGFPAVVDASKEGRKTLVEMPKQLLNRGGVEQAEVFETSLAFLTEARPLIEETNRLSSLLIHMPTMRQGLIVKKAALAKQGLQLIGLLTSRIQTVLIGTLHSDALLEQPPQRLSNRFRQNLAPGFGAKNDAVLEREDAASVSFISVVGHAYDTGTTVEPCQSNNTGEGEEFGSIGLVSGTQASIAKPVPFSPVS